MQISDLFGHHLAEGVEYLEKYADFRSLQASLAQGENRCDIPRSSPLQKGRAKVSKILLATGH
jgi:hypothetical protein